MPVSHPFRTLPETPTAEQSCQLRRGAGKMTIEWIIASLVRTSTKLAEVNSLPALEFEAEPITQPIEAGNWRPDARADTPLHAQLARRLAGEIRSGVWRAGDRLPSERALMQSAGVSRATVRQALETLERRGLVRRQHGRGTFVGHPRHEQSLQLAYSFHVDLLAGGLRLTERVLELTTVPADAELAERLQIKTGAAVIALKRLRLVQGIPMMLTQVYLPYDLCPRLLDETFSGSLYSLLSERYQLPVTRAVDRLEAIVAGGEFRRLLAVTKNAPLIFVERTAFTTGDVVLHLGYNYIRGDMCSFRAELQADAAVNSPDALAL